MGEDWTGLGPEIQIGGVTKYRCSVRETCARGELVPGSGAGGGRRRGRRRADQEDEGVSGPEARVTKPLTTLEEAMVKILPRWSDAWQAVLEYAHKQAGPFPGSGSG